MGTGAKVCIITGTARGIGAATARVFAAHGYATVLSDVLDEGQTLCQDITARGQEALFLRCDVADEAQVKGLIQATTEKYGRVDVLVNNAGVVLVKPLTDISWEEYRRVVDTNLGGTFLFCKHVLPVMQAQKQGAIVNIASVSGHVGQTDHALYGSTKGAILALTRALAWEVARYNIRVNSISPGSVDTPMLRGDIELESKATGLPYDAVKAKREAEQAFGRWADPSEVARAVYFLGTDGASFITGADLLVDCGWVAK